MWTATTGIHTNSFLLEPVYGYQIRSSYSYQCECTLMPVKLGHMTDCIDSVDEPLTNATNKSCPAWAREHCRICPSRFLAECHKRRLNQSSFVLLCFAFFFAFAGLYLVSVLSTGRAKKSYHLGKMLCLWNCSRYIYDICRDYRWGFGLHILQILLK